MRRVLALVTVSLIVVAPAGAQRLPEEPDKDRWLTVGEALKLKRPSNPVPVYAFLVAARDNGIVYACGRELQSYPPQCGGEAMRVVGISYSDRSLEGDPQRPVRRWGWRIAWGVVRDATPSERTWMTSVVLDLRAR